MSVKATGHANVGAQSEACAQLVCDGLLVRDPTRRLGSSTAAADGGGCGFARFQRHPFFAGVDWPKLERREVQPPFVPFRSKGGRPEDDVKNIDKVRVRGRREQQPTNAPSRIPFL